MFEWDESKAAANLKKHKVLFEEAVDVFFDPKALEGDARSDIEPRFFIIGRTGLDRILLVIFALRRSSYGTEKFRIISARPASRKERSYYERR